MKAGEHREIGDSATGHATVRLGTEEHPFVLGFGDVVALSGDYFTVEAAGASASAAETHLKAEILASDELFRLALVPGRGGSGRGNEKERSQDEIICALHVIAVDQNTSDPRLEPGGEFAGHDFTPSGSETTLERRVRDRFLALGASNDDHFVTPGPRGPATADDRPRARFGSASLAYHRLHQRAVDEAWRLGTERRDISWATALEAAAQHFLTDAVSAGHLRTPVAAIREYWQQRYPSFWEGLRRKVGKETLSAMLELLPPLRLLPNSLLESRAARVAEARTAGYPRVSLGDLLAKVFHDWDNSHGLRLDTGDWLFGDGHIEEGVTRALASACVRSGVDDLELAYSLGLKGKSQAGEHLYQDIQNKAGAPKGRFWAESKIPREASGNLPQNWRVPDAETLWDSPVVGSSGTTVGEAITEALAPGEELPRRIECPGQGIAELMSLPPIPPLLRWVSNKACEAYQRGFIAQLTADPRRTVFDCLEPSVFPAGESGKEVTRRPKMSDVV